MNERKPRKAKVQRGRTGVNLPPAMQDKNQVSATREAAAHDAGRPRRISMSNMKKLDIPEGIMEKGYYYRWFQDKDGRIQQAKAAYYEHVTDEQGNNFTRNSGPYTLYLMRLRQEYRDEDNLLKRQRVAATLEAEAHIGAGEYAPDPRTGKPEGGTSAIQHHTSDRPEG